MSDIPQELGLSPDDLREAVGDGTLSRSCRQPRDSRGFPAAWGVDPKVEAVLGESELDRAVWRKTIAEAVRGRRRRGGPSRL